MKKILRSRLPERLAHRIPPTVVEIAVGLLAALFFLLVRMALVPVAGDRAPYSFVFLGVVISAVIAGWRSGAVCLIAGQTLAWTVIASRFTPDSGIADRVGGLLIATFSQAVILLIIALYQREVAKNAQEREKRMALLDEALREIDHRTRNNYQTVLAMIDLQARRASSPDSSDALRQVADRIQAIANASQQLAARSPDIDSVRLDDHLCQLVDQIGRGLSREEIKVNCDVDDVTASPDKATSISIIVNELVTNAIKHAFNGEGSGHVAVTGRSGASFELIVADNGRGIATTRRDGHSGLGTRLVESFARQLNAAHEVVSDENGTTHRLVIPSLS